MSNHGDEVLPLLKEWKLRPFNRELLRFIQRTEGLGVMTRMFPAEVINDDIFSRVLKDAFIYYAEFDERVQKLLLRAKHMHDEEVYGT